MNIYYLYTILTNPKVKPNYYQEHGKKYRRFDNEGLFTAIWKIKKESGTFYFQNQSSDCWHSCIPEKYLTLEIS